MRSGTRTWYVLVAIVCVAASVAACAPPSSPATGGSAPQQSAQIPDGSPTGAATVTSGVQRITVDASQGFWNPTIIKAKANLPLEIAFGQGQGCMSSVLIPDFGINQDLTQGGATVKLPAMKPGSYTFSCGMEMVFGRIDVQ